MRRSDIPRLFLRHSLPMIVVVLVFAVSVIAITEGFVSRSNFNQASQTLSQAAVYYDSILEEISALNLVFSTNNDAIRALRAITDMRADYNTYNEIRLVTSFLTATVSSQRYIDGIYIFIPEQSGFIISDAGLIALETYPDRSWFLDYMASPEAPTRTEMLEEGSVIRISQPILNTVGEYAGVIAVDLDSENIKDDFISYFSYRDMYLTVSNSEGTMLFTTMSEGGESNLEHFSGVSEAYGWVFDLYIEKGELYNLPRTIIVLTILLSAVIIAIGLLMSYRMNREEREFMNVLVEGLSGKNTAVQHSTGGFYRQLTVSVVDEFMRNDYLKLQKEVSDYRALQMQINPHFLFNTLDNIYWKTIRLAGSENDASHMIMLLSSLFKASLAVDTLEGIPLSDELQHARVYLQLQEYRFHDKFRYSEKISCSTAIKVPNMMLQPILENAISHGMVEGEILSIELEVHQKDGILYISVSDDGKPLSAEELDKLNSPEGSALMKSRSIGIRNIKDRLRIFSRGGSSMVISSDGTRGVTVRISIPL